jgi:hypothetical protein
MTWLAAHGSHVGRLHSRLALPCQDYAALTLPNDRLVLAALADGAGSAPLSHLGARAAVEGALQALTVAMADGSADSPPPDPDALFAPVLAGARAALEAAAQDAGAPLEHLAATLIAFVAAPDWLAALQLGDGFVVCRAVGREGSDAYELMFAPDRGEYANETSFLSFAEPAAHARTALREGRHGFICAASDGIERVAIDRRGPRAHGPFFRPFDAYLAEAADAAEVERALAAFLASDRLDAATEDDRTVVLCGWREASP